MKRTAILLVAMLMPAQAWADPCTAKLPKPGTVFQGTVRYVGDGDSFCVGLTPRPKTWIEVRAADFYAPELRDPGGKAAREALERLAMGKEVQCVAGKRSYDRVVATCKIDGYSLAHLMRLSGVGEGGKGKDVPKGIGPKRER